MNVGPYNRGEAVYGFIANLFVAIGVLLMTLCGGCGLFFTVGFLVGGPPDLETFLFLLVPLGLGGVPSLIGFVMLRAGRGYLRGKKARTARRD